MFDKAKVKIVKELLKKAYPDRDFDVEKIGNRFFMHNRDRVGCRDFLLKGTYTYDQVMELNKISGFSAGFGFCKELGAVAFIGVPNENCVQNSGYFHHEVHAYGQSFNDDEYYFNQFSDEDAKHIGNYTVYGMIASEEFLNYIKENKIPIEKINHFYDYRYKSKQEDKWENSPEVLAMDIRLGGTYSFYDARYLAYGSRGEFTGSSGENVPIQFAIVGENKPVGIMGLWSHYNDTMFRDVWGINEEEPEHQTIRFLSDEEAKKISDFKLYYFIPTHSFGRKKFEIEKIDRTLNENFDFIMEDGTDYRLQDIQKEKTKSLSKE